MNAFVTNQGILYLPCPMLSETAIRDRFVKCLAEVLKLHAQATIAEAIGVDPAYLSKIKTAKNPKIPALVIARFCAIYRYSPHFILLNKGDKRGPAPITKAEEKDTYYLRMIESLLGALIELKGTWSDATSELVGEAMRKRQ